MGKSRNAEYSCVTNTPMVIAALFGAFLASRHLRGETATMGQVIEGPWMRRDLPALMSQLDEELRRMIVVLAKVREDHASETAHVGNSQSHQKTDITGLLSVQPRIGAESGSGQLERFSAICFGGVPWPTEVLVQSMCWSVK